MRAFGFLCFLVLLGSCGGLPPGFNSIQELDGERGDEGEPSQSNRSSPTSNSSQTVGLFWESPSWTPVWADFFPNTPEVEMPTVVESIDDGAGNERWWPFCFENNNPCRRVDSTTLRPPLSGGQRYYDRDYLANNPVALNAFQLNFGRASGVTNTITAASFVTAVPYFENSVANASQWTVRYKDPVKYNVLGSGCTVGGSDKNAVGIEPVAGNYKILTGLYVFDEANWSSSIGMFTNAHSTAGKVWYSGMDLEAASNPAGWKFSWWPRAAPGVANFGVQGASFQSTSNATTTVSPILGWVTALQEPPTSLSSSIDFLECGTDSSCRTQALSRLQSGSWSFQNHVLIGFCLSGTKTENGVSRPLVLHTRLRSYSPVVRVQP